MSNQTAIQPRTPYDRLKLMINSEDVRGRFQEALGENTPAFMASVLSCVSQSDKLRECDPGSILTAAFKAAVLNLPVDPNIGQAWIIPYGGKAQFQMGYRGYIQLAYRTSQYQAINVTEVYEGEQIVEDRLTGTVKLNGHRSGDKVEGFVAYFKLINGFEKYLYMTVEQVHAHAKRYSKSYSFRDSAWQTHFNDMGKKTVLSALLRKWGLLSVTMQKAAVMEDVPVTGEDDRLIGEVIDMQFSEPEPAPEEFEPAAPGPSLTDQIVAAAVEAGLTENEHAAKATLKHCKVIFESVEQGLNWFKAYRGWRDLGAKTAKAAEYANNGEMPH